MRAASEQDVESGSCDGRVGPLVAYGYDLIPRVVLVLLPVLVNFDRVQIDAAASLGAGSARAIWDVVVLQILPSRVSAFALCAVVALGAYGTALALVGTQLSILPLLLYSKIAETGSDFPAAAALSVIVMGLCCTIVAFAEILAFRSRPEARGA
ncbi:MAG: hypothetical protein ACOYLQ_18340 [Hyphomicrobiaceae bacterium]